MPPARLPASAAHNTTGALSADVAAAKMLMNPRLVAGGFGAGGVFPLVLLQRIRWQHMAE